MKNTNMLKKNYEFKNILSNGQYYGGRVIEAFIEKKESSIINMLGVAVSKKVGNSVLRNRIKRLMKENYRLLEKDVRLGYSLVFLWKKKISGKEATFERIREDMINIFKNSGVLQE